MRIQAQGYEAPASRGGRSLGAAQSPNEPASQSCLPTASAPQRRPFVEERHDPRSRDVAGFQPVEPKARFGKQIVDLAVEVTPAREPQPERIEAILPAGDTRFRRASMLHE